MSKNLPLFETLSTFRLCCSVCEASAGSGVHNVGLESALAHEEMILVHNAEATSQLTERKNLSPFQTLQLMCL